MDTLSDLDGHLASDTVPNGTLIEVLHATVERFKERPAIEGVNELISYGELWNRARDVADELRSIGVGPGERVGVRVASGTTELYIAILGVLMSGAAYVPVDVDDPESRATQVFGEGDVCAILEGSVSVNTSRMEMGLSLRNIRDARATHADLSPIDDAWIIFTSGSTGVPKGVAASHRSAVAFIAGEAALWSVGEDDRVLAGLSVGFDASCEEMWLAWANGACLVPAPRNIVRSGVDLGPWLASHKITVVSTVPTLAAMWADDALSGVRLMIFGGEACPEQLGWRIAAERDVWNTYGPTEATVVSTAGRILPDEPITIGWPLEGWECAVIDENGEPVPVGEEGELVIAGVGLARYLRSDLDEEKYAPLPSLGWERAYRSGDMVRETPSGFAFAGRTDDQVKIGGRRIELGEIEGVLTSCSGVAAAAVVVQKTKGGNSMLIGYVTGDVDIDEIRRDISERLPASLVPLLCHLPELPLKSSGKADKAALPWPLPSVAGDDADWDPIQRWVADQIADQLGPVPMTPESDFFEIGGTSVTAAKLVSVLRQKYPSVAVADVYHYPKIADLADRVEELAGPAEERRKIPVKHAKRWAAIRTFGILLLLLFTVPQWVVIVLAYNEGFGGEDGYGPGFVENALGPAVSGTWVWAWISITILWVLIANAPLRSMVYLLVRRLMMRNVKPGRYPKHGWMSAKIWFLQKLVVTLNVNQIAGTPWTNRLARWSGAKVADDARLVELPPITGLMTVGSKATIEEEVDTTGWVIDGEELVIAEYIIGAGARVGTRALLMPGCNIGEGAEILPGSVVDREIPAGELWGGSPIASLGAAGETWPEEDPEREAATMPGKFMYVVGLVLLSLLPLLAALPGLFLLIKLNQPDQMHPAGLFLYWLVWAIPISLLWIVMYNLLIAATLRICMRLIKPGFHSDYGGAAWAYWFTRQVMVEAHMFLRSIFSSIYTASWLRLLGLKVGKGTEVSITSGLNSYVSFEDGSFVADDVLFATVRHNRGWMHVQGISVGSRTFLGNSVIVKGGTELGDDSLVGVLSSAPQKPPDGSSWLGMPPLELPRVRENVDVSRTMDPPTRLKVGRSIVDGIRILLPEVISVMLATLVIFAADSIADSTGSTWWMVVALPFILLGVGLLSLVVMVILKWVLMFRYRPGGHPLWSFFCWRDEIINVTGEVVAGLWMFRYALGTPIMPWYFRAMGSKVGKNLWCDMINATEFDVITLGDNVNLNAGSCLETHLFHDRVMKIGPTYIGDGATLGPNCAVLPDTVVGEGCRIGGRSVVMRGETLPPNTSWQGAPVVSA